MGTRNRDSFFEEQSEPESGRRVWEWAEVWKIESTMLRIIFKPDF